MEQHGGIVGKLLEFIEAAKRTGYYPTYTAGGNKAAIRLASPVLTDEERTSLDTFRNHLDDILGRAFTSHKSRISIVSLKVYHSRIVNILNDYEQYGRTPQAMDGWKRNQAISQPELLHSEAAMNRHELILRPDTKAILLLPSDLTLSEAKRIKTILDACAVPG